MLAVGGATSRVQQVAEAEGRVHDSFAKGGAVLRREGQGTVEAVAFPGEVKKVSWTSVAWSLMGARSSDGKALFRNINSETDSSR